MHRLALELLQVNAKRNNPALQGYGPTTEYLQKLGIESAELIFDFSRLVLQQEPELGISLCVKKPPFCIFFLFLK